MAKRKTTSRSTPRRSDDAPPPVIAVFGDDAFLKREALADVRHALLGENAAAGGLVEFDGRTATLAEIFDTLRTPPLFAARSVVIVSEGDALISRHREALEAYLAEPAAGSVLVLVCKSLPGNTRIHKVIKRVGRLVECKAVKYGRVTRWVMDFASKRYRKRIDWPTAELLRDTVGDETGRLAGEIEKLSIYVGSRGRIEREDIEALSPGGRVSAAFQLTDAIGRRDAADALGVVESLFESDRSAGFRLVGYLAKHVRRLWEARRLWDKGLAADEICRKVGARYFADRFMDQVRRFEEAKLAAGFSRLLQVDMAIKTGTTGPRQALEHFLLQMCQN